MNRVVVGGPSDWIRDHVRPGMVAVDVGANIGTLTTAFLTQTDQVYAIEPQAALCEGLRHLPVTVIHAAVTDREGETILYHSRQSPHASLYPANLVEDVGTSEVVRSVTLDGLQARGEIPPHIDVIKIDAQGADASIIQGALHLLTTQHPMVYIEVWPAGLQAAGSSVDALEVLLQQAGYPAQHWAAILHEAKTAAAKHSLDVLLVA